MNWTKLFACGTLTPSGLQGIPWRPVGGLACYTHLLIWTEQGTICVIPQTFVLMLASHSVYFPAQNHAMRQYLIYAWWSWWKKVWDLQQVQKMRLFYTRNYDVIYWMSYKQHILVTGSTVNSQYWFLRYGRLGFLFRCASSYHLKSIIEIWYYMFKCYIGKAV